MLVNYTILIYCNITVTEKIDFFVVAIHTQPTKATAEINALDDVYNTFKHRYKTDFGFIMGDFNYGGRYVRSNLQDHLDIDKPPFVRLISKTDGTTVKPFIPTRDKPKKPYDRIYAVPPRSATVRMKAGVDTFDGGLTSQQVYLSLYIFVAVIGREQTLFCL